jgi:hypothetical protein
MATTDVSVVLTHGAWADGSSRGHIAEGRGALDAANQQAVHIEGQYCRRLCRARGAIAGDHKGAAAPAPRPPPIRAVLR